MLYHIVTLPSLGRPSGKGRAQHDDVHGGWSNERPSAASAPELDEHGSHSASTAMASPLPPTLTAGASAMVRKAGRVAEHAAGHLGRAREARVGSMASGDLLLPKTDPGASSSPYARWAWPPGGGLLYPTGHHRPLNATSEAHSPPTPPITIRAVTCTPAHSGHSGCPSR